MELWCRAKNRLNYEEEQRCCDGETEDMMSEQQYAYDGRPGCVMRHKSRATGTTIGIYKADQAGLDGRAGEWIAICENHGERHAFPNLRHARAHYASAPWCTACHPDGVPGVPAPPPLKPRGGPRLPYARISGDQIILLNMRLYERLGSPLGLRVEWDSRGRQLVIEPAAEEELSQATVYPVAKGRKPDGTPYRTGTIRAMAPLRQSGLTPGRYKPRFRQGQVFLKASYKVEDQADEPADDAPADDVAEAQH